MLRREFALGLGACSVLVSVGRSFAHNVAAIKTMKPGDFVWRPELSPKGPVVVIVSLPLQLVHVYRNGLAIGPQLAPPGLPGIVLQPASSQSCKKEKSIIQAPTTMHPCRTCSG